MISLSDRLKPWSVIERRLRAIAIADLVLVVYNPASRSRREQIVRARELLLELRAVRNSCRGGPQRRPAGEELPSTTLDALDPAALT